MNEDVRALKDASENLNTRKSAAKKILTGIWLQNFENYERARSSRSIINLIKMSKTNVCEGNSSPMILIGNQIVYSWNHGIISLAFCPKPNNFPTLSKRAWNYSLISLVTIWLHILIRRAENKTKKMIWLRREMEGPRPIHLDKEHCLRQLHDFFILGLYI